jgi:Tol biopolymer transport system component
LGQPALLPDGSIVVSQQGASPGESDLQLLRDGSARPLVPAPGPDDFPTALPDGRIAFVSGRTGLASLWVVDPVGQSLQQLTNVGRTRVDESFVPPPLREVRVDAEALFYDPGDGQKWRVDHRTGAAEVLP